MIVEDWHDRWKPNVQPSQQPFQPLQPNINPLLPFATKEELDALRREVEVLKQQLARAQAYDANTGQPDCSEKPDKVALLRKVIEALGINPDEVLK